MTGDDVDALYRARDALREMTGTRGWELLAQWVKELSEEEARAIEAGVIDWTEYQRRVARLRALREVVGEPQKVIDRANAVERGETYE